jgi:DNA topoisomerase-3
MRVVVAEKPSVARDLARVLGATRKGQGFLEGNGLVITWCHGHLAELEEPAHYDAAWKRWSFETLPMVPATFALRLREGAKDQFAVIRKLLRAKETEDVVNACDAGREGELIFRYVAELAELRKPVLRLWTSSLTDRAIQDAWARLRPSAQYDRLGDAARCRSEADWLVGLNATRALTVRARDVGGAELLSVGRVQTPTLAMIVRRDAEIERFVPETFFTVEAVFAAPADPEASFSTRFFRPDLTKEEGKEGREPRDEDDDAERPLAERLDEETAAAVVAATVERRGTVITAERKRTRERPPLLYDLTSLQRRANQRYGLSAQRTLEVAQALYEQHKLLTYPRTDARYLVPDQVAELPDVLRGLLPLAPYAPFASQLLAAPLNPGPRVVNAAEVGDHPAIIPTGKTPSGGLDPDEKRIFDLVARRLLAALLPDAQFDVTRLVVAVPTEAPIPTLPPGDLHFRTRGRVCREAGWRAVDPPGKSVDVDLPPVEQGDPVDARSAVAKEGRTRPPRAYNDASILLSMETAGKQLDDEALVRAMRGHGLGTPATRAAILQVLLDRSYIVRQGRDLRATASGKALIAAVPVEELKSAELTAAWEGRLSEMADGRSWPRAAFLDAVVHHVRGLVDAIRVGQAPEVAMPDTPVLGTCPGCGKPVRERGRRFGCDTGTACGFSIPTTLAKRAISARMVKQLAAEGRTPAVKGFKSKAGKEFTAGLRWDPAQRKIVFEFAPDGEGDRRPAPKAPAAPVRALPKAPAAVREGDVCPDCGAGRIMRGRTALGCSRWREGCHFRTPPLAPEPGPG